MTGTARRARHKRKSLAALAALLAAMAVMAIVAIIRQPRQPAAGKGGEAPPQDCVRRMLLAARDGDVETWLDSFAGDIRERLSAGVHEKSHEQFAAELRRRESNLNGFAIKDQRFPAADEAALTLEKIYSDYNERYRVRLTRIGGPWKITEMTPLDRSSPEIPYGTPVVPVPKRSRERPQDEMERSK